jgi:hypothetical protein
VLRILAGRGTSACSGFTCKLYHTSSVVTCIACTLFGWHVCRCAGTHQLYLITQFVTWFPLGFQLTTAGLLLVLWAQGCLPSCR